MGFLFLILYPNPSTWSHTICHIQLGHTPSFRHHFSHTIFHTQLGHTPCFNMFHIHNFVTHHVSHTTLSHTIFHTQLGHTPSFTYNFVTHHVSICFTYTTLSHTPSFTHNFVTHHVSICFTYTTWSHHLSHTTLSHTIFHAQLCHTPSFNTQLCHTPCFTYTTWSHHRSHTTWSHTIFHTQLCHTPSFTHTHLCHTTIVSRGRRGTYGTGLALVARLGPLGRAVTPRHFGWQAWHLATSTVVFPGKRGTWRHRPSFRDSRRGTYGTGLALVARLGPLDRAVTHAALCVAGVALSDIYCPFAWQSWRLATFVSRGRRGTYGTGLALVARLGPLVAR